mgnify:CR=1 FL=1
MTNTEPQPDDMLYMVGRAAQYYDLLRAQGIPESLAVRMVGDWYNLVVVSAANYFDGRVRQAERSVSGRLARLMGKGED